MVGEWNREPRLRVVDRACCGDWETGIRFVDNRILGSFTTFSTFSAEWLVLMQENMGLAVVYGLGMTLACFFAAALGFKIGGFSK